jgi:hypothetical protein
MGPTTKLLKAISIAAMMLSLVACGGGNSTPTPTPTPTPTSSVTVAGIVTYTDFNISASGIDFANPTTKPIRGAIVELHKPLGTILLSANTTETGGYSFSAPANSELTVVVKAALGTPTAPDTKVINNTASDATYTLTQTVTTVTSNVTNNFNAGSGWDTTTNSYTENRNAAPFAILDTIHQGRLFVQAADTAVVFPELNIQWSSDNKTATSSQNIAIGDGPGTSYNDPNLWLNGASSIDTDEYDSAVIAHEWGHYFQSKLGRSDNPGGDHTGADIAHPSLAMDEGFATAMGSMIMDDTSQINTFGTNPPSADVLLANIETDSRVDTALDTDFTGFSKLDGFYSEQSLIEVIWDLFDSGINGNADDDGLALGFKPLYTVMTNGHASADAFTSIYSFIHHLKIARPNDSDAIDAILLAENIDMTGADEFENANVLTLYTPLTVGATPISTDSDGDPLQTFSQWGNATVANSGGNKLLNFRFFKFSITTDGCYTFTATPTGTSAGNADLVFSATGLDGGIGNEVENKTDPEVFTSDIEAGTHSIAIGAHSDNAFFTFGVAIASAPALCD